MARVRTYFKQLPKQLQFLLIVVVVMVGMWLFITPLYDFIVEVFGIHPVLSVIIGAVIVYAGIRLYKLHLW